jgi:type IV pilus assembly protein PilM
VFRPYLATHVGPIGIDFSAHGVRLLQLRQKRGGLHVVAGTVVEMPPADAARDRAAEQLAQGVLAALGSFGFLGRRCVVSLRREDMLLQSVRLPQLPDAELRQAARWEAADRLHLESEAIEVDFIRMGEIQRPNEVRDEVLLVAALRATLQDRLNPLIMCGLRPVAVDASFAALARCHSLRCRREADRDHVRALLEVGATGSTFMVLRGDQIAMCKALGFGGREFDAAVAAHLGIEPDVARDLRAKRLQQRFAGAAPETDEACDSADRAIFEAVRPAIDQLIKEVGLCLRYYNVTFRGKPAEQIILAGSEGLERHLDDMLSRGCKLPVVLDDPKTPVGELFDEIQRAVPHCAAPPQSWAVAAGLSLRGLMPRAAREQTTPVRRAAA